MPSCTGSFVCSFTPVLRHAMLPTCHGIWHGYNCMPMGRHARPGPPLTQAQPCCLRHRTQPRMGTTIRGGQTCHQESHRVSAYPSLLTAEDRYQPPVLCLVAVQILSALCLRSGPGLRLHSRCLLVTSLLNLRSLISSLCMKGPECPGGQQVDLEPAVCL